MCLGVLLADGACWSWLHPVVQAPGLDTLYVCPGVSGALGGLPAIDRVIRISPSRRKLLGIDAPTRTGVRQDGMLQIEMIQVGFGGFAASPFRA